VRCHNRFIRPAHGQIASLTVLSTLCVYFCGLQILMLGEGFSRRNRFIVSCALAFGMGVSMVPQWSKNALWPDPGMGASQSLQSVRTAVLLILDTGFCVGAIVAFVLNMIVPHEESKPEVRASFDHVRQCVMHSAVHCVAGYRICGKDGSTISEIRVQQTVAEHLILDSACRACSLQCCYCGVYLESA
jgi:hypothetical protein